MLAVATSIDALAAGISFAALTVDIVATVSLIGVITFGLSFVGVAVGHFFGARYEKPASIVGGVVLILIGLKVLLEHLAFCRLGTGYFGQTVWDRFARGLSQTVCPNNPSPI